jgi:hypothetical protein
MGRVVKIVLLADDLQHIPDDAVVPHHAAEHGTLRFEILRR